MNTTDIHLRDIDDYFHNVSKPVEITYIKYLYLRLNSYRATKALAHLSIKDVHVQAQIATGSHPFSFKVLEIKKKYVTNET